jgi:serine/threonine protein kinase/Tfp pilus assembly protein PilF
LGKGSFARVFLAREPMLGNRLVAVKVSLGGASEAHILGRLGHPNIVPVYSAREDTASGLSVVCMPYLGSATLCDVLDRAFAQGVVPTRAQTILNAIQDTAPQEPDAEPATSSRFLQRATYVDGIRLIAAQLAEGLACIHERGICHRDLKPSNVLMSRSGTPMLLDFNLSADAARQHAHLGGTLPYMSPEQLLATDQERQCDPALLNARADLFSLGVILFELLSGQHPFGPLPLKLTTQELRKHLLERQRLGASSLRQANPAVDKPLAHLVERCLKYNPNDRAQSAACLAAELRKGLRPWRRAVRWIAHRPRTLVATILLCLTLFASAGYLWSLQPPYSVRQFTRGVALYRAGQYQDAVHHFDRALEADPNGTDTRFARGRAYTKLAETDSRYLTLALADYHAVDPLKSCGMTKACLGYCLNLTGQTSAAIAYHGRAIEQGWATAEVFNNLGYSHLRRHNLDDAERNLNRALCLKPDCAAAYYNRALVALKRVQAHPAFFAARPVAHDGRAEDSIPSEVVAHLERGIADVEKAIALGSSPFAASLYYDAARLCAVASRRDPRLLPRALDYLSQAIAHGVDPKQLKGDAFLAPLQNDRRFQELLRQPSPPQPLPPAIPIVDPLPDLPD